MASTPLDMHQGMFQAFDYTDLFQKNNLHIIATPSLSAPKPQATLNDQRSNRTGIGGGWLLGLPLRKTAHSRFSASRGSSWRALQLPAPTKSGSKISAARGSSYKATQLPNPTKSGSKVSSARGFFLQGNPTPQPPPSSVLKVYRQRRHPPRAPPAVICRSLRRV